MTHTRFVTYGFVPLLALLIAGCAHTASKPTSSKTIEGYVVPGTQSQQVVRTGTGQCLRTGTWTREDAIQQCDPNLIAKADTSAIPQELGPPTTQAAEGYPVEQEPTPAPVAVAPARTTERIQLGADAYFDFDKAQLRPRGENVLDKIAQRAKDGQETTIEIVGHADQIGTEQYNLELSQRRADAVRAYLVDQGVAEDAIRVEARGETDPVVRCEGKTGSALIGCLQPNRRSEITFSAIEEVAAQ